MNERCSGVEESENPCITEYGNALFSEVEGSPPLMSILPDDWKKGDPLPPATFQGEIGTAFYYGLSAIPSLNFEDNSIRYPMLFQQPPTADVADGWYTATWGNTSPDIDSFMGSNTGLFELFYCHYFAIVRNAETVEVPFIPVMSSLMKEDFRSLKNIKGEPHILSKICGIDPGNLTGATKQLIKWKHICVEDFGKEFFRELYAVFTG